MEHVGPRKWREEKERRLADREAHVGNREKQAATVIQTAKAVAEGDPKTLGEMTQPDWKSIAARLFGRAFVALRKKAREEARQEARAEVQTHFEEIKAADDAIVAASASLPDRAKKEIIKVRRSLVGRITTLKRAINKWHQPGQNKNPEV